MARVRIGLAGRLAVEVDGRRANETALGRQGRLVFAYLVCERHRPVPRDELAELVWGERLPPTWETGVRGLVARVRSTLRSAGLDPAQVLTSDLGCYHLRLPAETVVDVEEAERRVALAYELIADSEPTRARVEAESAVTVARQAFLPGTFGLWVEERQNALDELRVRALEAGAKAALAGRDWNQAHGLAEQAVRLAPLRESAHRILIEAMAAAGNRGEALQAYERCRCTLVEELGVNPAPETEALYLSLLEEAPPRSAWPAAAPAARATELPDPLHRTTRLVGRTGELHVVRDARARVTTGRPEVVVIVGEAGIGKTRLAAEITTEVAAIEGARVLYGRCDEEGARGFQPLVEALEFYVAHAPGAELEADFASAGVLARLVPSLLNRLPTLTSASLPTDLDKSVVFEAVRATLVRMARGGLLLLVIDDVHWVDRSTLALLRHLLRAPGHFPLLVVATYRTGEPGGLPALTRLLTALRRERPVQRVDLTGLEVGDVARLVEEWAGHPSPPHVAASIHDATEGNPFFVHELLRLLAERGELGLAGGLQAVVRIDDIPEGVREVILARVGRLAPRARRVLGAAAVLGHDFDLPTLEAMDDLAHTDVLGGIEEALTSALVTERAGEPDSFGFTHGLVRETVYRELVRARRQRLHGQAAAALEERRTHGAIVPIANVARHLLAAGPHLAERAVTATRAAGAYAVDMSAYDEAVTHYQAALDALDRRQEPGVLFLRERCDVLVELAAAHWRAGDTSTARRRFEEAAEAGVTAGLSDVAAQAALGAAGSGPGIGRSDPGLCSLMERALQSHDVDDGLRGRMLARLGAELASVDSDAAERLLGEGLQLTERTGNMTDLAYALHMRNWTALGIPSPHDGLARADRILALADRAGDRHMSLEGRLARFTYLLVAGRAEDARTEVATIEQAVAELRQPFYQHFPLRFRACIALAEGRLAEAEQLAADAYSIERRVHPPDAAVHALLHRLALRHAQGRLAEMADEFGELSETAMAASSSATGREDGELPQHMRAAAALMTATSGNTTEATAEIASLMQGAAGSWPPRGPIAAFTLAMVAETCIGLADERLAHVAYGALLPWRACDLVGGWGLVWFGSTEGFLGRLALVTGQWANASAHLSAGIERDTANGAGLAAAACRLGREQLL